jgi:hypothetical protein
MLDMPEAFDLVIEARWLWLISRPLAVQSPIEAIHHTS